MGCCKDRDGFELSVGDSFSLEGTANSKTWKVKELLSGNKIVIAEEGNEVTTKTVNASDGIWLPF